MTRSQLHLIEVLVARWSLCAWMAARLCACGERKAPTEALCPSCEARR
ncbi:hypothetical protein [Deinococcus enclensis]|uniref:Uncharacterized protein n=1 Tax=Deinococcus enclensis TaxID=1049582 RepID=A0ABT9MEG8_9DEIO|nr:hypothetical protein [Deinococcus enclensis]MDP9764904.1 hypothetical protein [Deinococcus enclensis]